MRGQRVVTDQVQTVHTGLVVDQSSLYWAVLVLSLTQQQTNTPNVHWQLSFNQFRLQTILTCQSKRNWKVKDQLNPTKKNYVIKKIFIIIQILSWGGEKYSVEPEVLHLKVWQKVTEALESFENCCWLWASLTTGGWRAVDYYPQLGIIYNWTQLNCTFNRLGYFQDKFQLTPIFCHPFDIAPFPS